jgi:hypothetical protein
MNPESARIALQLRHAFAAGALATAGREYDSYYLFLVIVQHSLYHTGQIAILRSASRIA